MSTFLGGFNRSWNALMRGEQIGHSVSPAIGPFLWPRWAAGFSAPCQNPMEIFGVSSYLSCRISNNNQTQLFYRRSQITSAEELWFAHVFFCFFKERRFLFWKTMGWDLISPGFSGLRVLEKNRGFFLIAWTGSCEPEQHGVIVTVSRPFRVMGVVLLAHKWNLSKDAERIRLIRLIGFVKITNVAWTVEHLERCLFKKGRTRQVPRFPRERNTKPPGIELPRSIRYWSVTSGSPSKRSFRMNSWNLWVSSLQTSKDPNIHQTSNHHIFLG